LKDATVPAGVKQAARFSLLILLILCFSCRSPEKERASQSAARTAPVEELDVAARAPQPSGRPRVIWLGLDGLDWEILDRLVSAGRMPNWKRLAAEGWPARLRSFSPLISPILWASAATGTSPDVHPAVAEQRRRRDRAIGRARNVQRGRLSRSKKRRWEEEQHGHGKASCRNRHGRKMLRFPPA